MAKEDGQLWEEHTRDLFAVVVVVRRRRRHLDSKKTPQHLSTRIASLALDLSKMRLSFVLSFLVALVSISSSTAFVPTTSRTGAKLVVSQKTPTATGRTTRIFTSSSVDPNQNDESSDKAAAVAPSKDDQQAAAMVDVAVQAALALAAVAILYVVGTSLLGFAGAFAQQAGTAVSGEISREAGNVASLTLNFLAGVLQFVWQALTFVVPALFQAVAAFFGWAIPTARSTAETVAPYVNEAAGQLATAAAPFVDQASTTVAPYVDQARTAVDATVVLPFQTAVDSATAAVTTTLDSTVQSATNAVASAVDSTVQSATEAVDANLQSASESLQSAVQKAFSE